MMGFFQKIDPLILDVAFVAIIILIIFFGALKSFKKVFASFLILIASLFLAFSKYTNSVKQVIVDKFKIVELLPAGSNNTVIFVTELFASLISALLLFILLYSVLHAIKMMFKMMLKRRNPDGPGPKTKIGRVFGAIFSFVYQGAVFLIILIVFNSNFIGMNKLIEESTVTKFVVKKTEKLLTKQDADLKEKITLKIFAGDVLYKVDDSLITSYKYMDEKTSEVFNNKKYIENLEDTSIAPEEVKTMIKDRIIVLHHVAIVSSDFDDQNSELTSKFIKLSEEWLTTMNKTVKVGNLDKLELSISEFGLIKESFEKAGMNKNLLSLFEEITEVQ